MLEKILPYENELFFLINSSHTPYFDRLMWMISSIASWIPLILLLVVMVSYKKNWKEWMPAVVGILGVFAFGVLFASGFMKPLFERLRPTHYPGVMEHVRVLNEYIGGQYGFISGHSTNSFGFAMFTSLLFRNRIYTIIIFFWAILVAYSRIYLGVHFISDITAGLFAGLLIGFLFYKLYLFVIQKEELPSFYLNETEKKGVAKMTVSYVLGMFLLSFIMLIFQ